MMVKVCGVTTLEDALAAATAGADAIGFNFCPSSPRYLTPENAAKIGERLPGNVRRVAVFLGANEEEIETAMRVSGCDIAQIHGAEQPRVDHVWRAIHAGGAIDESDAAEAFLFDAAQPGSGKTFDWSKIPSTRKNIILAGGLDGANVAAAIRAVKPWGVDAASRLESSPGRKDAAKVREFVRQAKSAL